jgi:lipopolysaccharide/colanic/teichoic acid biosynthesis glycosyltransferase
MHPQRNAEMSNTLTGKRQEQPRSTDDVCLPRSRWYDSLKIGAEFSFALLLAVFAAPVVFVAAILIKLTSRGPAFYTQTRLGRDGHSYTIYKLRSMRHNCEKDSGPCWSKDGDPRITPVGRFLRRTHIDELPQLWNVLRGDMSLVGPRPERPEFIPHLEEALPFYRSRLLVRPGVTGLAQVQLPPDTDLASVRRKLAYDLFYVRYRNPWLDFRLILATALHMVGVPYALLGKLLRLPAGEVIEQAYQSLTTISGSASNPDSSFQSGESDDLIDLGVAPCV